MGRIMAQHSGGIGHDYKRIHARGERREGGHRWPWFAAGLLLPVAGVLIIGGRPDAAASADASTEGAAQAALSAPLVAADQPLVVAGAVTPTAPDPITTTTAQPAAITPALRAAANPLVLAPPPDEALVQAAMDRESVAPLAVDEDIESAARLELRVARGDTLERMFRRHELSLSDMFMLLRDDQARRHLSILRPGDVISVEHEAGRIVALSRELDEVRVLEVSRDDDGFRSAISERAVETRVVTAQAVIRSSLFNAGRAAGVPDSVTMSLAGLFQWDVDFALDIREGDQFSVVYQELWRDGERLRTGNILAAEFVNRGRTHRAVRFEMDERADYFSPEGRSLRRAFIRAPVDFTRISSRFNLNRRHPVLHTIRAHRGVDYAAPTGTPIKAAGDGRVIFRGVQGGYGNTVILQHGGNITTLYAHMSRFHPEVRHGTRVRQGQVIGYVGMTGLATGPHLHYEYRVNGVHRDPLTVELPPAEPVPAAYRERFFRETAPLLAFLDRAQEAGEAQLAMSGL